MELSYEEKTLIELLFKKKVIQKNDFQIRFR